MEKIFIKTLSSLLLVIILFAIAMPIVSNAAEGTKYKISDMKLNRVIYFKGQTYSSVHYKCNNAKYAKKFYSEETAALVWKINRNYKSIVIQLNEKTFRTIKVEQVTNIRDGKFLKISPSSFEELQNGEIKLNVRIEGVKGKVTDVDVRSGGQVHLDTDGHLVLGFENGFSQIEIQSGDSKPILLNIIKDANGNIGLDLDERFFVSADIRATILERIRTGAEVSLQIKNGKITLGAAADVANPEDTYTYVGVDAEASYDIQNPEDDIRADVKVDVMDTTVINETNRDTKIIKTIKSLISKLKR